jgi:hypothetical protein
MFVDREELAFLNRVLARQRPGPAQLLLLYGRGSTVAHTGSVVARCAETEPQGC